MFAFLVVMVPSMAFITILIAGCIPNPSFLSALYMIIHSKPENTLFDSNKHLFGKLQSFSEARVEMYPWGLFRLYFLVVSTAIKVHFLINTCGLCKDSWMSWKPCSDYFKTFPSCLDGLNMLKFGLLFVGAEVGLSCLDMCQSARAAMFTIT